MNPLIHYSLLLVLPTTILVHLFLAPYTKVEESFNIQAAHDILKNGIPLSSPTTQLALKYDHVSYPGAVPRTFIGALSLAELARPFTFLVYEGVQEQMLVRAALGLLNAGALLSLHGAVRKAFGDVAGVFYILLQSSQFHLPFYASRTLPNTFALVLTTTSFRYFVLSSFGPSVRRLRRQRLTLYLLTLAGVIFRSELLLLLIPITLSTWLRGRAPLQTIVSTGLASFLVALLLTVSIDSFFWQRIPLWPELHALLFNTVQGHASEWGTEPFHYYFSSALPRLLLNPLTSLLFIPTALAHRTTQRFALDLLMPCFIFVLLFSFLPHKETRFILYVVPIFTALAASGASTLWTRKSSSVALKTATRLVIAGSIVASLAASLFLLTISALNYPGATALETLHSLADGSARDIHVHLGNLACQTGVTRFLQRPDTPRFLSSPLPYSASGLQENLEDGILPTTAWHYDKSPPDPTFHTLWFDKFDYVIAEAGLEGDTLLAMGTWDVVGRVNAFGGIKLRRTLNKDAVSQSTLDADGGTGTGVDFILRVLDKVGLQAARLTQGRWISVDLVERLVILRRRGPAFGA